MNPAGGSVVYASWNGSTELDTWTVLAGTTAGTLAKAGVQRRAGFETAITVNTKGPYFAAAAALSCGHAYPARPARVSPPAPTTAIPPPWRISRRFRPPRLTCRTSALYTLDVHLMTWGSSQERIQGFAEMSQSSLNAPGPPR